MLQLLQTRWSFPLQSNFYVVHFSREKYEIFLCFANRFDIFEIWKIFETGEIINTSTLTTAIDLSSDTVSYLDSLWEHFDTGGYPAPYQQLHLGSIKECIWCIYLMYLSIDISSMIDTQTCGFIRGQTIARWSKSNKSNSNQSNRSCRPTFTWAKTARLSWCCWPHTWFLTRTIKLGNQSRTPNQVFSADPIPDFWPVHFNSEIYRKLQIKFFQVNTILETLFVDCPLVQCREDVVGL